MPSGERVIGAPVARGDDIERLLGILHLRRGREHDRSARIAHRRRRLRRRRDEPHDGERRERHEGAEEAAGHSNGVVWPEGRT